MTRTLLVGTDGSPRSDDALAAAALIAPLLDATPVLLYAHPYGELESLLSDGEYERLVREVIESTAERARAKFAGDEAPQLTVVAGRSPAAALHEAAQRQDVAAVVLGSSHRGRIGRVLPGGVAQRLLSGAPCPIVIAPAGYAKRRPPAVDVVGVGFDGSVEAAAALRLAAAASRAGNARLRIVAVHQRIAFGDLAVITGHRIETVNEHVKARLAEGLERAAHDADAPQVTPVLREGNVAAELAAESEDLSVLVVGSRGYGPVGSVLLGSVSSRLMSDAACPVMVVPRGAARSR